MAAIADAIRQWAVNDGDADPELISSEDGKKIYYGFQVGEEGVLYTAFLEAHPQDSRLQFYVYVQETIPESRRAAVAELLTWINNDRLVVGNFELDPEDGRLRFRAGIEVEPDELTQPMIERLVLAGTRGMLYFHPAFRATAFGGASPRCSLQFDESLPNDLHAGKVSPDDAPEWSAFPGSGVLRRWAEEVKTAIAGGPDTGQATWRLIGPAMVIEHEYPRVGTDLARRLAFDCGLPLLVMSAEEIASLASGRCVFENAAPLMLYIEPGVWQRDDEDETVDETAEKARNRVLALLRAFNPARPLICVTATRALDDMATALKRTGAFDRQFILPPLSPEAAGYVLLDMVGRERCGPSITDATAKVGKLMNYNFGSPEGRKQAALRLQRLHEEIGRPLEFLDLVELSAHGVAEADKLSAESEKVLEYVAIHEAGHATVAVIDSGGHDVPEYSSIAPSADFRGVVIDSVSYAFAHDGIRTYANFRHSIRVSLGGRAAEELIYGPAHVTSGCRIDIENSTRRITNAIAYWGFMPGMDEPGMSAKNLAVVIGKPSPSEEAHVEKLVREFLEREYRAVLEMLAEHRKLLESIAARLKTNAVLDQSDLLAICRELGVEVNS